MNENARNRRLTTVLAADLVGYSRLMANDEVGTISDFKQLLDQVFRPNSVRFNGRIVKLIGDGILMEFPSVVDSVNFAVQVQLTINDRNADRTEEKKMRFRVGINIGDVITDGDDIHGTGVNVAARLETLADPGGVCISGTVHEHVAGKVDYDFQDLGAKAVKNIPEPVQVFRILYDQTGGTPGTLPGPAKSFLPRVGLVAAATALGLAVGFFFWQGTKDTKEDTASFDRLAFPLPDKPSIAVLPFEDLSEQKSEEVFADGVTEDLITDLSKVSELFVIASNSSFSYKGEAASAGAVAETLGVRYVLEGSVRRAGTALRVNAQLIDTTTGVHIWAERFDGDVSDVFAVQDQIVVTTVSALRLKLTDAERDEISKNDTKLVDAKQAFQQGWELYSRFNELDNAKSVPFFEQAISLDPEYGRAYGALALVYLRGSIFSWDKSLGEQEANLRHVLAPKYLKLAEQHGTALVHVVRAMQHLFYRHSSKPEGSNSGTDDARREAGAAIAAQPNDPEAHIMMGWALIAAGKPEEGLNFVVGAKRLNPNYPSHYAYFEAAAKFAMGDLESAANILRASLERNPHATELMPIAASVFANIGLRKEARSALMQWQPDVTETELDFIISHYRFPITWVRKFQWLNTKLTDGLRLAAVPQDQTVLTLMDALDQGDDDPVLAIRKLGWFGPAAAPAVTQLTDALSNQNKRVRREAVITLGKIGPAAKSSLPELKELVDEPIIGFHARPAIKRINGD